MHRKGIAERIKGRRELLQINQEVLATLSGVSLRTLKQIESGNGNPTVDTLSKLGDVLGLELRLVVKNGAS